MTTATTWAEGYAAASVNGETVSVAELDKGQLIVIERGWPRMLTVEMAAAYTGMSEKTLRNHGCKLPGKRKWGGLIVFDRRAIDGMLDRAGGVRDLWVDAEKLIQ